jgi:hypothetical protein
VHPSRKPLVHFVLICEGGARSWRWLGVDSLASLPPIPAIKDTLPDRVRFGVFELDLRAGELCGGGRSPLLQGLPLKK